VHVSPHADAREDQVADEDDEKRAHIAEMTKAMVHAFGGRGDSFTRQMSVVTEANVSCSAPEERACRALRSCCRW